MSPKAQAPDTIPPATPEAIRLALGLTVTAAGRKAEMDPKTVLKIEAGDPDVTVSSIERLAAAYGVERNRFIDGWKLARAGAA